jgi:hypothetical protein
MQLNLHELINQPGYGKANEAVRKAGYWVPFETDTERMDWLELKQVTVRDGFGKAVIQHDPNSWSCNDLRESIDAAAIKELKEEPQS